MDSAWRCPAALRPQGRALSGRDSASVPRRVTGGGEARPGVRRPQPLGARGCHVVGGRRGCGRYIRGSLVSCHPRAWGSWGLIEAVGREMLGELVGSARMLEVFVQC